MLPLNNFLHTPVGDGIFSAGPGVQDYWGYQGDERGWLDQPCPVFEGITIVVICVVCICIRIVCAWVGVWGLRVGRGWVGGMRLVFHACTPVGWDLR